MADYGGTILFVSHDEYFISRLATRIVEVRPGRLRDFPGNLSDYRYYLETLFRGDSDGNSAGKKSGAESAADNEKETRIKEREQRKKRDREAAKIEQEIARLESEIAEQESILNDPANALNYGLLHEASDRIARLRGELDGLMERWMEVS